jgi:hypothetical protein
MATIDVLTEARAQEILGQSIVSGEVTSSGLLEFTKGNGQKVAGGDFEAVIGPMIEDEVAGASFNNQLVGSAGSALIPLTVKGANGQTANLQVWVNNAGVVLGYFSASGTFKASQIRNTIIDANENTLSNVDATKLQGRRVFIQTGTPSGPATGDIWINPNGT